MRAIAAALGEDSDELVYAGVAVRWRRRARGSGLLRKKWI
jgi:hypothetical protein